MEEENDMHSIPLDDHKVHSHNDEEEEEGEEDEEREVYRIKNANNHATPESALANDEYTMDDAIESNMIAWRDSYFKLMNTSIKQFHKLLKLRIWDKIEIPNYSPHAHIDLFQKKNSPNQGFYTLKVECVIKCRAERVHYLIRDHNKETRMRWDRPYLVDIGQHETYMGSREQVDVVYSEIDMKIKGVSNRYMLGIQWQSYNQDNDSYTYIFKTTCHQRFRAPKDRVNVMGLFGTIVRTMDDPLYCHLIMVAHVNPGDKFPSFLANQLLERFRERAARIEHVAKHWNSFYFKSDDPTKIENRK
jgi:hypothetical protein